MDDSWEGDWRAGEAPRVIFDVGGDAGVMEWDGLGADGTRDASKSLVFVVPPEARRTYEGRGIFDRFSHVVLRDRTRRTSDD